jgi:hypothetical protein
VSLSGHWEGRLIDAGGATGLFALDLRDSRGKLSGDFAFSFVSDDDDCGVPPQRMAQSGAVEGSVKGDRLTLEYEITIGLEPIAVRLEGEVVDAMPHARRAVMGCYDIAKGGKTLTLDGGACVLWLYGEGPKPRGRRRGR